MCNVKLFSKIENVILACTVYPVVLYFTISGNPVERGFFCDDDSIRYPLGSETITTNGLIVVALLSLFIVYFAVETPYLFLASPRSASKRSLTVKLLQRLMDVFAVYLFGACLTSITVYMGKFNIGRLRPHFLDVCQLNETKLVCSNGTDKTDSHLYISKYQCMGNAKNVREARLSFPSGHSALGFYTSIYISIFLQHRLSGRNVRLPRHLGQAAVLLSAWFTALSRVQDYWHHPTDVLAGILIGTVWAVLVTSFVIDLKLGPSQTTKGELPSEPGRSSSVDSPTAKGPNPGKMTGLFKA